MKRLLFLIASFALMVSCVNEIDDIRNECSERTFYATTDAVEPDVKASLDGSFEDVYRKVLWEPGDKITVIAHDDLQKAEFSCVSEEASDTGWFSGTIGNSDGYSAFFPSCNFEKVDAQKIYFTLPQVQVYAEDNVEDAALPMVAKYVQDEVFSFSNLCGIMEFKLTGYKTVRSISFKGFDETGGPLPVCGSASVEYGDTGSLEIVMSETAGAVLTLDCGETGKQLSKTDPTPFHIVLPPATYSTFDVVVMFTDGTESFVSGKNPLTIVRSERKKAGVLDVTELIISEDLATDGTSNCYIVTTGGSYYFPAVKGNSSTSVGTVATAQVLWESFGTDVEPNVGDLIKSVSYSDGYITFMTADNFKEGNAVIAAKDASGTILWSWHIWFTDQPKGQVYYNGAGTMMDRNLGATSATSGDVGALGLLYQWGRKDPFLGSSSISDDVEAKSTISWPSAVESTSSTGTISYATAHPSTFITENRSNYDWYYTGSSSTDDTRWTTSSSTKSIYDPCPAGWRVPDGGDNGVWSKALGSSSSYTGTYNSTNEGMNFSGKFGSASAIWYPASGYRDNRGGSLLDVGGRGYYCSASPINDLAYYLYFGSNGFVNPSSSTGHASGRPVRCLQENSVQPVPEITYKDVSTSGTSNCYLVSEKGAYKFPAVKGNSSTSVGTVASAQVLWESFGTSTTPQVGDLIKSVSVSDGNICYVTADTFKEGNAVIAAKNSSGTILWSWHIWFTDQPQGQTYYNNAGTMMDRNLGATSATPGDVGALGLLYQWGRKDPFLGSSSISSETLAKSTITWPSTVSSNSSNGTIAYATAHPTTFITYNSSNLDWYYTGTKDTDNTRWTTSDKTKSIYDPCPAGWRVPDGGGNGVWSKANGSSSEYSNSYNSTNEGMNFSGKFGSASTIWYPAAGFMYNGDADLGGVGDYVYYWSASPYGYNRAYSLYFTHGGDVDPSTYNARAFGHSVRCLQE